MTQQPPTADTDPVLAFVTRGANPGVLERFGKCSILDLPASDGTPLNVRARLRSLIDEAEVLICSPHWKDDALAAVEVGVARALQLPVIVVES